MKSILEKLPKLQIKSYFTSNLIILPLFILVFAFTVRGNLGNPTATQLNNKYWKEDGPFELSPERGRFTLMYSLVEDHSFFYSVPLARFALPDLAYTKGHYVSMFAPLVSYLVIPGYVIGKYLGIAQVGAFSVISLFAVVNAMLISLISRKLGATFWASIIASIIFLFASPAFAYGVNLYQHHISVFLILLSLYILIKWEGLIALSFVWLLCAAAIPVDYPNLVLMVPIGILSLFQLGTLKHYKSKLILDLKLRRFLAVFAIIIPLSFFLWFNYKSYGNPLQLSGTVGSVKDINEQGNPSIPANLKVVNELAYLNPDEQNKSAVGFFQTRNMLNGFYIHLISPDRGVILFTPITLLGILGIYLTYKKNNRYLNTMLAIITLNLLLYSMWGDPWGGWAFGSRYLIPAYALLSTFSALALTKFKKNILFLFPVTLILLYSIAINTLGAITTSAIPPKVQVLKLEEISGRVEYYNFFRNWEYLKASGSKSFLYRTYFSTLLSHKQYYFLISGFIYMLTLTGVVLLYREDDKS